jgi:hypothetical protein
MGGCCLRFMTSDEMQSIDYTLVHVEIYFHHVYVCKKLVIKNEVLSRWIFRYPFDYPSQATLGSDSSWMGDRQNDKYAGCC